MKRITVLAASGVLVATPAIGAWAASGATDDQPSRDVSNVRVDDRGQHARHGADDPAGHVRHHRHLGEAEPGDEHDGHSGRH